MFSIIIPTYNRAHILPRTIASVLAQTYTNWECIIVDDGSTDNTKELIASYTDPRITYIYQLNAERSAARNNGIRHAQGEFICFLDSDDEYLPEHLEVLYSLIIKKNKLEAFFFTGYSQEKFQGNFTEFFWRNPIIPAQMCMHKAIFNTHEFIEGIEIFEDMALCMEISLNYPIFGIMQKTVRYNKDQQSSTWVMNNSYYTMYRACKKFFAQKPFVKQALSKKIYNEVLSEIYFGIVKYGVLKQTKNIVVAYTIKSIITDLFHVHNKHRIYILLLVLFGKFTKAKQSLQV